LVVVVLMILIGAILFANGYVNLSMAMVLFFLPLYISFMERGFVNRTGIQININDPLLIQHQNDIGQARHATGLSGYETVAHDDGIGGTALCKPIKF
jgi:hypothetical protein